MIDTYEFYKRDGSWYIDLPKYIEAGGTEEDCEMVGGADTWLDLVSDGKNGVTLVISDETVLSEKLTLYLEMPPGEGAVYVAYDYKDVFMNHQLWLCDVTKYVFGEFPKFIYYKKV